MITVAGKWNESLRGSRKVVLLFVGRDEIIETEFHHRDVQQVGGFDWNSPAILSRKLQGCVEHFVVVHFDTREDSVCPQKRSSLSCASSSVAVGPATGPG